MIGEIVKGGEASKIPEKMYAPKGQMRSECIYETIYFPKYHQKNSIDFCTESLFRLGMLCTLTGKSMIS